MNQDDNQAAAAMFVRILGASETEAHAVLAAGHTSIEEVAYVPLEEFNEVEGVEGNRLAELRERARRYLLPTPK